MTAYNPRESVAAEGRPCQPIGLELFADLQCVRDIWIVALAVVAQIAGDPIAEGSRYNERLPNEFLPAELSRQSKTNRARLRLLPCMGKRIDIGGAGEKLDKSLKDPVRGRLLLSIRDSYKGLRVSTEPRPLSG